MLQRRFRIGYTSAAKIIDRLEENGVIGPYEGSTPRKVLIKE
ncbi:DNA translocase FtsK, partial [Bacillus altitudinis]|nr:DNA translocase FtsK [Bacillus altitudinis]